MPFKSSRVQSRIMEREDSPSGRTSPHGFSIYQSTAHANFETHNLSKSQTTSPLSPPNQNSSLPPNNNPIPISISITTQALNPTPRIGTASPHTDPETEQEQAETETEKQARRPSRRTSHTKAWWNILSPIIELKTPDEKFSSSSAGILSGDHVSPLMPVAGNRNENENEIVEVDADQVVDEEQSPASAMSTTLSRDEEFAQQEKKLKMRVIKESFMLLLLVFSIVGFLVLFYSGMNALKSGRVRFAEAG